MPNQADLTISVSGSGSLIDTGKVIWSPLGAFTIGSGGFDPLQITYTHGSDDDQVSSLYVLRDTVLAGQTNAYPLYGGIVNFRAQPIYFTAIKFALIQVVDPDGVKSLTVGPQGLVTDGAATLWFSDVSDSEVVTDWVVRANRWGGWAVDESNDSLMITGAATYDVDFNLVLAGLTLSDETGG